MLCGLGCVNAALAMLDNWFMVRNDDRFLHRRIILSKYCSLLTASLPLQSYKL